jgi:hypothetical protein
MEGFDYSPSQWVPFRDTEVLERVRRIKREEITKHPNPDFQIRVVKDDDVEFIWMADMFYRMKQASDAGERLVMIVPNPWPSYRKVAYLINKFKVNCENLYVFGMDEYADEDGTIAPETWRYGLIYAR